MGVTQGAVWWAVNEGLHVLMMYCGGPQSVDPLPSRHDLICHAYRHNIKTQDGDLKMELFYNTPWVLYQDRKKIQQTMSEIPFV